MDCQDCQLTTHTHTHTHTHPRADDLGHKAAESLSGQRECSAEDFQRPGDLRPHSSRQSPSGQGRVQGLTPHKPVVTADTSGARESIRAGTSRSPQLGHLRTPEPGTTPGHTEAQLQLKLIFLFFTHANLPDSLVDHLK